METLETCKGLVPRCYRAREREGVFAFLRQTGPHCWLGASKRKERAIDSIFLPRELSSRDFGEKV